MLFLAIQALSEALLVVLVVLMASHTTPCALYLLARLTIVAAL